MFGSVAVRRLGWPRHACPTYRNPLLPPPSPGCLRCDGARRYCTPGSSANINQDTGIFGTGHTIAHETGHNLGMIHDDDGRQQSQYGFQECKVPGTTDVGIMNSVSGISNDLTHFTDCSAANMLQTINAAGATTCLDDAPGATGQALDYHPGERLSAYEQCLALDPTFTGLCHGPDFPGNPLCVHLQCLRENRTTRSSSCTGVQIPFLDGTRCGTDLDGNVDFSVNKWCMDGECVSFVRVQPGAVAPLWQ